MAEFLSPDWIAELDAGAAGVSVPEGVRVVVQQIVVDGEGRELAAYAVRVADGQVRVVPGRVPDAEVTFTQDRATAAAVARGELAAQRAFLDGRLRVGGDLARVREAGRHLGALTDLFAAARAGTTW